MATDQRNILAFLNNDADFRAWGVALSDQLADCGLVKTSDTGQIDWATVARPGTSTVAGYEVYRFNDGLQATKPIFIKIEYGIASVADRPSLWITVGTATNGAGTLSGQTFARKQLSPSGSKTAAATLPSYCSGDGSRIALCTHHDQGSANFSLDLIVDRTRDASGAATGDGFLAWVSSSTSGCQCEVVPSTGTQAGALSNAPACSMSGMVTKVGVEVALAAWAAFVGKALSIIAAVTYNHADIGELVTFQATHLGSTRTFMPMGDGIQNGACGYLNPGNTRSIAILWE